MKPKQIFISILAVLFVFPLMGTFAQQAASSGSIEVITTFDYPGAGNLTFRKRLTKEATSLVNSSIQAASRAVLSVSAMVALARRSLTLTIPSVLPKDAASITHAQWPVTTSSAMVPFTRSSFQAAPSQSTMFQTRSKPICSR